MLRTSFLLCVSLSSTVVAAGPYLKYQDAQDDHHLKYTEFYDDIADAKAACAAFVARYGAQGGCNESGSGGRSLVEAGWLCAYGPGACQTSAAFVLYDGWACATGHRWAKSLNQCVPVIDIDRRHKMEDCNSARGNPIYPLTGVKKERVDTGLTIGALPLVLTYSSANQLPMESGTPDFEPVAAADGRAQGLGPMWTTTLHRKLVRGPAGVVVGRGDGSTTSFIGTQAADADVADQIDVSTSPMRYVDPRHNALELYDPNTNGRLQGIEWASGERLALTYSDSSTPLTIAPASGYLIKATDNRGRSISFEYNLPPGAVPATGGLLSRIIDPTGRSIQLTFNSGSTLTQITWQDGTTRRFLYEQGGLPKALTGVVNERSVRAATFTYDAQGRATATQHGNTKYSAISVTPPRVVVSEVLRPTPPAILRFHDWAPATGLTVQGPLGLEAIGSTMVQGKPRVTSSSQPAGAGCGPATSQTVFDLNGNLASTDDFNGHRTCFTVPAPRNLEVSRVEGLASSTVCSTLGTALPLGARRITTTWHPDWALPTQVARPLRKTTWVYHGQLDPFTGAIANCSTAAVMTNTKPMPLLCKLVEQATTDETGAMGLTAALDLRSAARTSKWLYDAAAQLTSATDASGATTTFTYKAGGDLDSVSNAKGHTTTYLAFDGAKQPLSIRDPNGVVTDVTYDPRGRLATVNVAGRVTQYTYWLGSLPATVTEPDGQSRLTYFYNSGEQLTQVNDSWGNSVDFTFDAAGNRLGETTRDRNGLLKTQLTMTRDALGRIKQLIGSAPVVGDLP